MSSTLIFPSRLPGTRVLKEDAMAVKVGSCDVDTFFPSLDRKDETESGSLLEGGRAFPLACPSSEERMAVADGSGDIVLIRRKCETGLASDIAGSMEE